MFELIVAGVISGVVVLIIAGIWKRRGAPRQWVQEQHEIATTIERKDARQELTVLREQVLEVARARNVVIPTSSKGINPTIVTRSDGSVWCYFNDHARYVQAMRAGQVPPTRSSRGTPPEPVSRWTREALEQWLAENTD
ncbi:hypothetical protein FVO59_14250 [Microbacterium esteraromaticum]|uniref:Uncharacterized protein n=1 Tax=Microbacterium esteraromaticum TaxID=57043 RepID=A0A7D7WFR0_9MICO|nr:hypothetical protein [Microbacterium esteraromaticum]QMU98217.1 hypothetical protein FVO59_14250 [Microbacterium esteraromaticum]